MAWSFPSWKSIVYGKIPQNKALYNLIKYIYEHTGVGGTVGTSEIEDGAVTTDKVHSAAISYDKLDTNTKQFKEVIRIPADGAAGDTWDKSLIYIDKAVKVIDVGIIPDTQFGQATDYAALSLINKGNDGAGTTVIASKTFNSTNVADAYKYTSLGTVSNADIAAGSVLSLAKAKTGDGQIVPAAAIELILERAA
ncbi:MAG: hypothetical protein AMQ22_00080 [Candidatus Methanofastidiosum methylothiophilum]|uniref:Uncharacterized protein n=1 Tax=Candidatus Methanofastidiosum methylothiophilum TaxID=1705564 RepID=A0A150J9J9_9EURY|nr:MAG: hypothetical protein AMQ22_00080 [Candidatus Methanofastidiosum methylthiophilus]